MDIITIVLNFDKKDFSEIKDDAQKIHDGLVAEVLTYPLPIPTMVDFQGDIDAMSTAITDWGPKGNRGSHQDHLNLIAADLVVKNDLRQLRTYSETTTPNDAIHFAAVGWVTKHQSNPLGALPGPNSLRVVRRKFVVPGHIHYRWSKVNGANAYKVWIGDGAIIPTPPDPNLPYFTVTKAGFDDTLGIPGAARFILVGCVGANPETGFAGLSGNIVP